MPNHYTKAIQEIKNKARVEMLEELIEEYGDELPAELIEKFRAKKARLEDSQLEENNHSRAFAG